MNIEERIARHTPLDVCGNASHANPEAVCPECDTICDFCAEAWPCDARVLADALAERAEVDWEYARMNRFGHVSEADEDLVHAQRRASGYPDGYKGGYQTVVRRRKAGPWHPINQKEEGQGAG